MNESGDSVGFDNKLQHRGQSKCGSANVVICYAAAVSATSYQLTTIHSILRVEENTNTDRSVLLEGGEILENF